LTYFGGGDGFDGALAGEQGQSVTNIQHTWYTHVSNGSPYDCNNAAVAGPTAVSLQNAAAHPKTALPNTIAALILAAGLASGVIILRQKTRLIGNQ
ncbi:MAG: hypothetical protein GY803_06720, partial [Chloroflexi bacterium]|nr:hypothetical protein [Chloroflexota bacterium]